MKKSILTIGSFLLSIIFILSATVLISGCNIGLNIGFVGVFERLRNITCAVKSYRTVFDVNDVTLDFYYGGRIEYGYADVDGYRPKLSGVALYFCNEKAYDTLEYNAAYEDYQNMEGFHFVKFVSEEEFNSGEYEVELRYFDKVFKHSETLTVPSEIFSQDEDHFCLAFVEIYTLKEDLNYYVYQKHSFAIRYKFLNEHTVLLSEPSHSF